MPNLISALQIDILMMIVVKLLFLKQNFCIKIMENHKDRHVAPKTPVWDTNESRRCPFLGGAVKATAGSGKSNRDWWPNM